MKSSRKLIPGFAALCLLAMAGTALADPQAVIQSPKFSSLFPRSEPVAFDVSWTSTLSGSPLDHYATQVVSEEDIQFALLLGSTPPSHADLQTYFGGQAPGFIGWTIHGANQTGMHVEGPTPGKTYYLALTVVDQSGAFDGIFDLSRNLLRFKMTTELAPPYPIIDSPAPSSASIVSVPASFNVNWFATFSAPGTFLDHSATHIVSEHAIQQALGLGSTPPTNQDLQTYFGGQAPAYAGWTVHPPNESTEHVQIVPDGQVYYFALAGVDDLGAFVTIFDPARNVLRFTTTGPVPTQVLTWGAIKASRR